MILKILFYFLQLIAKLPIRFLYLWAYPIKFSLWLAGYRKKVILTNFDYAFPNKTKKEKTKLLLEFYTHLSEYFIETIIALNVDPNKILNKHVRIENEHYLKEAYDKNQEVFVLCPHIFNWEWASFLAKPIIQENVYGIFKPIKNKVVNQQIQRARFRMGGKAMSTKEVFKTIFNSPNDRDNLYFFVVDQSPRKDKIKHHLTFFNKKTPVFDGFDVLIRKKKACVLYCEPKKIGQGNYTYTFTPITPDNNQFEAHEIVAKFYTKLEESIIKNPSNWLWSHKRWKD